jgi:RHS repeat-associated protein
MAAHGPRWVSGGTIDTTSYGYNAGGYLQTITDALGHVTTVTSWDWRGAPLSFTDPNGVATTLTYDIHGRLLTATINPGASQSLYQFAYDAVGDLTTVTLPLGATLSYVYDQDRRLTTVTNVRGETRTYAYDNASNPLSLTTATAAGPVTQVHTAAYDDWSRIIQSVGAAAQAWNLAYDNLSNLTSVTDPPLMSGGTGAVRTNTYDPLNRLKTQVDPESHTVSYAYDPSDTLDQLTDARLLNTTREIDGFGETIQEVSPDRGTLSYWYDLSGNLTERIDGDAVETDFTYDAANRRATMTFPSDTAENTTFTYDQTAGGNFGIGRLTSVTEGSGSTSLTYDAQGRLIADAKVINGGGLATPLTASYGYDANGRVISVTYPSGDVVNIARTTDGLVTGVTETPAGGTAQTIASGVGYEPYGPIAGFVSGNGLGLTRTYDQDYRLTGISVAPAIGAATLNLGFGWQTDGRISGVTDPGGTGRAASYGYTLSGRVATATGPWGAYGYAYDPAGNRTTSGATTAPVTATVASTSNQVIQTSLAGVTQRTLNYRTGGDLSTDSAAGGTAFGYGYNAAKRMTSVTQNGVQAGAYQYDFAGRRVYRQTFGTGAAQTAYVYDPDGHLVAEHDAVSGAVEREYVWIDDMPVALLDISGGTTTTSFIHTGQIDEPLAVTNAAQALVWNAYIDPFGIGVTFSPPTTTLDMRLPGQSLQIEADNLHQNGYRDYDPSLGRYIEADPLGIEAGQNLYGYVYGDPLNRDDLLGLYPAIIVISPSGSGHVPMTSVKNPAQAKWFGLPVGTPVPIPVPPNVDPQSIPNYWHCTPDQGLIHFAQYWWPGGDHDFKKNGHPEYDAFGNFEYGASGAAAGYAEGIVQSGADAIHGGFNNPVNEQDINCNCSPPPYGCWPLMVAAWAGWG